LTEILRLKRDEALRWYGACVRFMSQPKSGD
jgi:hypothetical protein